MERPFSKMMVSLCAVLLAPLALASTAPAKLFPDVAGKPHTYVIEVKGMGVPLNQSALLEARDSFVAWAAASGWKLAAKSDDSTAVVHLTIGSPSPTAKVVSRATIWSNHADIEGGQSLDLPAAVDPTKSCPQVTSYGIWNFALSDSFHPLPAPIYHR